MSLESFVQHAAMTFSSKEAERTQGERFLLAAANEPGFAPVALQIISAPDNQIALQIKQAVVLRLKNYVKEAWFDMDNAEDPRHKIQREDREILKGQIVSLMVVSPPLIRIQLAVIVEVIAKYDFPVEYPSLLPDLVQNFTSGQFDRIMAVLECADLVFKKYRSETKSDRLWGEIKYVLHNFAAPLLQLFQQSVEFLYNNLSNSESLAFILDTLQLIGNIHFSLCSQDIPEVFEDNLKEWMPRFTKLLELENSVLPAKNQTAGPLEKLQSVICEIVSLYSSKYEEEFESYMSGFVGAVWQLVTRLSDAPEFDMVIVNAISLLTSICSKARYHVLFASDDSLKSLVERVVIPNLKLRALDLELFEFNGIDYVRSDWEGSNQFTRRRVATDLVRALCQNFEQPLSIIVLNYVQQLMTEYEKDRIHNWIAKDTAMSLILAVSVQGSTERHGATRINKHVNILDFFQTFVLPELQSGDIEVNPMLKATSLRFVSVFRVHLPREALGVLMPLVLKFLKTDVYVVHTYAATTIEKLVDLRDPITSALKFTPDDLSPYLESMLVGLFDVFKFDESAENEYVMQAIVKICEAAGSAVTPFANALLDKLGSILARVANNPKSPAFNHDIFEAIASLIVSVCSAHPGSVQEFEKILIPVMQSMLSQDTTRLEFGPYVFQIFSQLLMYNSVVSEGYKQLFPYLMQPAFWEHTGNSLGLVQLMNVYLSKPGFAEEAVTGDQLKSLLGVFQKLLSSMNTDSFGMDLLKSIVDFVPWRVLSDYFTQVWILLFTRAKSSLTDSFAQDLLSFIGYFAATVGVDKLVSSIEAVQAGMFGMVLEKIVLAKIPQVLSPTGRKNVSLGLIQIVFDSPVLLNGPQTALIVPCVVAILDLVEREESVPASSNDQRESLMKLQEGGFSNVFSKLRSSNIKSLNKLKEVDTKQRLQQALQVTSAQNSQLLSLIQSGLPKNYQQMVQLYLASR